MAMVSFKKVAQGLALLKGDEGQKHIAGQRQIERGVGFAMAVAVSRVNRRGYCTTANQSCAGEHISQGKPGRKGLGFAAPLESNSAGNAEKLSVSRGEKTRLSLGDSLALCLHLFVSA